MHNKCIRHFLCQIPPDILTHFLVFSTPEGSPNAPKIGQISGGTWQKSIRQHMIISHYKIGDSSMEYTKFSHFQERLTRQIFGPDIRFVYF